MYLIKLIVIYFILVPVFILSAHFKRCQILFYSIAHVYIFITLYLSSLALSIEFRS